MLFKPLKPLKEDKEFKEEEEEEEPKDSAITLKFPPISSKLSNPSKDAKEFKEEDSAFTSKSPPISVSLPIPSYEVIQACMVIKFPVIFFKLYNPSRLVRLLHSIVKFPSISVSKLSNFCKVRILFPCTIILPITLVYPAVWKSIKSCSVSKIISPVYVPFAA